jgi:glutamate N-acetyltransferase/amino-acid N-acetyltransferase
MADRFSLDATPAELADIEGFKSGAGDAGLKSEGPDLGVILSEDEGCGTALFSRNASRAPSVRISRPRALAGRLRAVVANTGNANCFTGEQGLQDARQIVSLAAEGLGVPEEQLLVASAGVAGEPLPMDGLTPAIGAACAQALGDGRGDFAGAIVPVGMAARAVSASGVVGGKPFRIAGVTRGLDLSDTGMANVFAFIVTDAALEPDFLQEVVSAAYDSSFGRLIVDAGIGTNDTLCVLSSGRAGNEPLGDLLGGGVFAEALAEVVGKLALDLAFDESRATRLIDVEVSGASSDEDAETVARAIASSTLVRIAVHAGRAGWELVLAAAGRSGARVVESRATVRMGGIIVYDRGRPAEHSAGRLAEKLSAPRAAVELDLGLGEGAAGVFTCTLSDSAPSAVGGDGGAPGNSGSEAVESVEAAPSAETAAEIARLRAELAEKTEKLEDIDWEHAKELRLVKREAIEDAASADDIPAEMQKLVEDLEAELEKVRNSRRPAAPALDGDAEAGAAAPSGEGGGDSSELRAELERVRAELEAKDEEIKDLEWQHAKELRDAKRGGGDGGDDDASNGSAGLEAKIEELQEELKEAREQAKTAAASGSSSDGDAEALRAEFEEVRAELAMKDEEIKDLEWQHAKELREAKKDAGESPSFAETGKAAAEAAEAAEAAAEMKARIAELEEELEEAKAAPAGGGKSNMELLEKINDLQAQLEDAQEAGGSSGDASGGDGASTEEIASLREEIEKKDALIKEMEFEHVQALREARKQAAAEGESSGESSGDSGGRVAELEKELEKAEKKAEKRAEKIAELREKLMEAKSG